MMENGKGHNETQPWFGGNIFLRSEINAFIQIHKGIESNREVKQDIPTLTIQDAEND